MEDFQLSAFRTLFFFSFLTLCVLVAPQNSQSADTSRAAFSSSVKILSSFSRIIDLSFYCGMKADSTNHIEYWKIAEKWEETYGAIANTARTAVTYMLRKAGEIASEEDAAPYFRQLRDLVLKGLDTQYQTNQAGIMEQCSTLRAYYPDGLPASPYVGLKSEYSAILDYLKSEGAY